MILVFLYLIPNLQLISPFIIVGKFLLIPFILILVSKSKKFPREFAVVCLTFVILLGIDLILTLLGILHFEALLSPTIHWLIFIISLQAGYSFKLQTRHAFFIFVLHFLIILFQFIFPVISSIFNQMYGSVQDELSAGVYRRHSGLGSSFYASVLVAILLLKLSRISLGQIIPTASILAILFMSLSRTSLLLLISHLRISVSVITFVFLAIFIGYQTFHPIYVLIEKVIFLSFNLEMILQEKNPSVAQRVADYVDFFSWIQNGVNDATLRSIIEKDMEIGWFMSFMNGYVLGIGLYVVCFFMLFRVSPIFTFAFGLFEFVSIGLWRYDVLFLTAFLIGNYRKCM